MPIKILINAIDPEACRIAKVKDSKLEEFHIETTAHQITHGNIYKGVIARIEPSLQACFVNYGGERHGFLQKHDIHSDYYLDHPKGDRNIQRIVKRGQELMVQVTKDPEGKKGAMLTTFISLPGRYLVLMPGSDNLGVSRKIEDEAERDRLRKIIKSLNIPDGFGAIVRTAGNGCSKTLLSKDFSYLMRLWKSIKASVMQEPTPSMLYKERNLVLRSLRDYYTPEVTEILIDEESVYREAKGFMHVISPKYAKIVKHYRGARPIFSKHELESQIATIFENRVELKSGGSIVIDQTEALVAIDVNSGKATRQSSFEQTAFNTNVEAAEEIARQLRLRDMGGLIVLDFIDMRDQKHRREVERTLKQFLKTDKAKSRVGRISRFGLLEMSRQRLRPSIRFGSYETCWCCQGKGQIPSSETLGLSLLRSLKTRRLKGEVQKVTATVPPAVADYLLNNKRQELLDFESQHNVHVVIQGNQDMAPGESDIQSE